MINRQYFEIHRARYDFVIKKIGGLINKGDRVLDVGCYPMHLFDMLKRDYKVEGISSEFEKVKNVESLNIEQQRWPYKAYSFDLVLMTEIVEHLVGDPEVYLKEAKRVLKPGGKLLITTPNAIRLQNLVMLAMGKNIYFPLEQLKQNIYFRHNREYTLEELKGLMKKAGFEVEGGYFVAYPPNRKKNKGDGMGLKIAKWVNYLVTRWWKSRSDSLWLVAYSR